MKTILKLWRGEINQETLFDPAIKEKVRCKQEDKIIKESDEFFESLSKEQKKLLLSYWAVESESWSAEVDEAFISGFKTGALLMMDILEEKR